MAEYVDRYVDEQKIRDLSKHELTLLTEGPGFKVYRLGKPGDSNLFVRLVFTGDPLDEQIILSGDIHPGPNPHGCVSNMGYGIDWFGGRKSTDYLCSKFLPTVWVPEVALDHLKDQAEQMRADGTGDLTRKEVKEHVRKLAKLDEAIEAFDSSDSDDVCRTSEAFHDYQEVLGDSPDGAGFTYSIRDGSWLVAIQRRFAECYQALLAAEAAPPVEPCPPPIEAPRG